jgi:hypothetical protein
MISRSSSTTLEDKSSGGKPLEENRQLSPLLGTLRFQCNNTAFRPVMDAIELLGRYKDTSSDQKFFARGEKVPIAGVVPKA